MEQILDDIQYLRTGDHLTLIAQVKVPLAGVSAAAAALGGGGVGKHGGRLSVASGAMHGGLLGEPVLELIRVSLAADGFGTNLSHLENLSNHDVPGDIVSSTFLCENALSKKSLQEQLIMDSSAKTLANTTGSGYKTLLYGHAVCFKHVQSEKYLACMASSPSSDKLAFEIGLVENTIERAWWIIEPSNKQRSEGDKVKIGDEVILISVSSERYMHAAISIFCPLASFQPSCWAMGIVKRGDVEGTTMGFIKGGDTIRLQKGFDECLSVVGIKQRSNTANSSPLTYEFDDGRWEGRSLWRIEFVRSKWNATCLQWGQPIRVRHVVSGRYLHVRENNSLALCEATNASCSSTLFALYSTKEDEEVNWDLTQEPNQGQPCIKYNEHPIFIKHVNSQSWLSYSVIDSKVPGKMSGKRVVLLPDGHTDDAFVVRVSQYQEGMASRFIMKALKFFNRFIVALKSLTPVDSDAEIWSICSVDVVITLIEDLIAYFAPPDEEADHEEKHTSAKNLKLRQDLFQSEGFILVIREMVDCLKEYKEHFSAAVGLGAGPGGGNSPGDEIGGSAQPAQIGSEELEQFDEISSLLFELLASLIRGNRVNCSKFSEPASLDWLMSRLHFAQKQDALDVLYCLLQSSPEAVNIFTETHIKILLNMIDKFGKDHKVLEVMRTLCVSQNEAVRANQNSFLQHFTASRKQSNLTFHTKITEQIVNVRPNAFIGMAEGSAMYYKWYFEVHVENILRYPHTHLRVGVASTPGFTPYSNRGSAGWGGNGVGDDMFSWGFDGKNLWTDGCAYPVQGTRGLFQYDDVIGCCVDFTVPRISFTLNGIPVLGVVETFPVFDAGLFHPVASMSSLIQIRFVLGGKHGSFAFKPPEGYAPVCELVTSPDPTVSVVTSDKSESKSHPLMGHCVEMSTQDSSEPPNQHSVVLHGPCLLPTVTAFHPQPVDLQKVNLAQSSLQLRKMMAEWFHEQWSISKIEGGWIYGEQGIDEHRRYHDCLKPFGRLNEDQQYVEIMTADEIIRTVLALGYTIKPLDAKSRPLPKRINLPNNYVLSNGYKPAPFDISIVQLGPVMSKLVELLAENTHNIWAEAKIARSWTHGAQDSASMKRTPLLTEYKNLDPVARKGVRNSAVEAIKLIVVLGYRIEAPIVDVSDNMLSRKPSVVPDYRVYRADYTRSVTSGKLYYEFEPLTQGFMLIGWAQKGVSASKLPACDSTAFLFNGFKGEKQNELCEKFGKVWSKGDVVGCFVDIGQRSIAFSLNGQMMMDVTGRESAFDHFNIAGGLVPVFCLARGERGKVNFGNDPNSLRFYFANAYHQGFVPLCFETKRPLPLWASLRTPHFRNVDDVTAEGGKANFKSTKTMSTNNDGILFPALKMTWEGQLSERSCAKTSGHFLRLNLPVQVTGKMPVRPGFLTEMEIANAAISASKASTFGYAGGGGGGQYSGPVGENTIMEESEEDPDLNRPPIEYSKIRKKQDPTSLLALFQPSSKGRPKVNTAANLKLLQTKHREQPVEVVAHSDDEDSEEEPSFVIGFADESLKKIMKTTLRNVNSDTRPYRPSVVGLPNLFTPGSMTGQKNQKKFEELFNFEQNGSRYQFSVRVYQGQDTSSMLIGWASSSFSGKGILSSAGSMEANQSGFDSGNGGGRSLMDSTTRNAFIKVFDNNGGARVYQRRNLYMASVAGLCAEAFPPTPGSSSGQGAPGGGINNALTGLQIDVMIDVTSGVISFVINKQICSTKFQVETGQMLFPCVYVKPTCKDTLQFELTRSLFALPLSCEWMGPDLLTNFYPECPPCLSVQVNDSASWLALPEHSFQATFINAADKGWRVLTDIPHKFCSLLDSATGTSYDIVELTERTDWLEYHCKTLQLYSAMCEHGNHKAAHILTDLIDEKQFLFLIQCNRLPGPLRLEFFNLLIAMHFQYRTDALLSTSNEFIFTLPSEGIESLPKLDTTEIEVDLSIMEFPNLIQPEIEPVLPMADAPKNFNYSKLGPPKVNTDELKHVVIKAMEQSLPPAGEKSFQRQDPPGGSHSYFLVPCLKLINCLLLNGLLSVSEMQKLVAILDPHLLKKKESGVPNMSRRKTRANSLTHSLMNAGLIHLELEDMAKVELIKLMTYLKSSELRQIIGQLVQFANNFVGEGQFDQRRRYIEITTNTVEEQASVLAMKTKEFRCKPLEQMKSMISYREVEQPFSPCRKDLQELLHKFHSSLLEQIGVNQTEPEENKSTLSEDTPKPEMEIELIEESRTSRMIKSLLSWLGRKEEEEVEIVMSCKGTAFRDTVVSILVEWAKNSEMQDDSLIQSLFLLLFRQYDEINQLIGGLEKTYVVGGECESNVRKLLTCLCTVRQLLNVSMGSDEEKTMIDSISEMTFNTVFYQHPELIRKLNAHESVMTVMVNIMSSSMDSSSSGAPPSTEKGGDEGGRRRRSSLIPGTSGGRPERRNSTASGLEAAGGNEWNSEIVSVCCRFLSFFCRSSCQNQKAVFEKLDFLLENITMGLAYPSLRGSTPLDVAAASIKNNEELALALRQHHLESVIKCLCDCGLASNPTLLSRGVADIGWDPVVGERLLEFLKTTVWVSGESVEQNAFQIVRMLVRRPECLGPALRAGGKGLLEAVGEAIELQKAHNTVLFPPPMSGGSEGKSGDEREVGTESVIGHDDPSSVSWTDDRSLIVFSSSGDRGAGDTLSMRKDQISFKPTPDDVQIGDAVLDFYAALINLLGCCSPAEHHTEKTGSGASGGADQNGGGGGGGGETQRVRAILQSLVPMEDLKGILGMNFSLPSMETLHQDPPAESSQAADEARNSKTWAGPLKPHHKASIVRFWDRVYGISEAETLEQLISIGFLPDLRTAVILDTPSVAGADFSVALNRYICQTVLPLLTRNARLFEGAGESSSNLVETLLITIYRFYRCRTLSNAQRGIVNSFFSTVIQYVRPQTIHNFLLTLSQHLADLEPYNEVVYEALSIFLQHNKDYYSGVESVSATYGMVSDEERSVLLRMFETFFDALIKNGKIETIEKAMPALLSLVGTIPPDYLNKSGATLSIKSRMKSSVDPRTGQYIPRTTNFESINLNKDLADFTAKYAEQVHDEWSKELLDDGWTYGMKYDDDNKKLSNLKPYKLLHDADIEDYKNKIRQKLRIVLSLGFQIDKKFNPNTDVPQGNTGTIGGGIRGRKASTNTSGNQQAQVVAPPSIANFRPNPLDLSSVALSNELIDLANLVGECCHDLSNNAIANDHSRRTRAVEHTFVPYELLTMEEKEREWKGSHNFIKFLIVCGFQLTRSSEFENFGSDASLSSGLNRPTSSPSQPPPVNQKRFSLLLLEKVMVAAERTAKAIKDQAKAAANLVEGAQLSQHPPMPEIVGKFSHVVIPVIHHYVFLYRTYYTGTKENNSQRSADQTPSFSANRPGVVFASVREKELLLGLFCRLFASLREQKNSRSAEIRSEMSGYIDCIKAVAEALEFSAIAGSSNPTVLGLVHIFFLSVVNELKSFRQQMISLAEMMTVKETRDLKFIFKTVLPVLKLVLRRIGSKDMLGKSIILGETQFCCYELLEQMYLLGADQQLCNAKQRSIVGDCLSEFAQAFPVAFLEPLMTSYNKQSILNNNDFKQRFDAVGLCGDVPTLDEILNEVNIMASAAAAHAQHTRPQEDCYDPLLVIEVLLPITCIYLSNWIYRGPDYELVDAASYPTNVTHAQLNSLLSNVLSLITNNFGVTDAVWMTKIAKVTQPIWKESVSSMLTSHYLPALRRLAAEMSRLIQEETRLKAEWQTGKDTTNYEDDLQQAMTLLMRDIYCFLPFLLAFMDQERVGWNSEMPPDAYEVFELVTTIFACWAKSQTIRREESNFVSTHGVDTMALISGLQTSAATAAHDVILSHRKNKKKKKQQQQQQQQDTETHSGTSQSVTFHTSMSLIMVACKRMVPVGLNYLDSDIQEVIQSAKHKYLQKSTDEEVKEFVKSSFEQYKKQSGTVVTSTGSFDAFGEESVLHISKVLQRLHFVDHPPLENTEAETRLLSRARKRSVMQCFQMVPLYTLPRHKAVNLFVKSYQDTWLSTEEQHGKENLIESLTTGDTLDPSKPDPLTQLITFIKRGAQKMEEESGGGGGGGGDDGQGELLYISYAELMSSSCSCQEDDEDGDDEGAEPSFEEQEMAKQKLLSEQARLKERGAAEMILLRLTKCGGVQSEVAEVTLQMGISVLTGGNVDIQTTMLNHLYEKKDVAFFDSIAAFMQSCSVLNLDSFERCNKAEDQVSSAASSASESASRVMDDSSFTTKLFRFLQLLCEGHNAEWQNYLRVQEGNTSSVNLINASVDYLVRLQESMSDFYWHYSSIQQIDNRGREAFMVAILVGKQVFASLTEMIQGPCTGNQLALTHSRLWDAVSGFFHIFANLQLKLSQDPEQMEFLRELMDLQKEMVTLLLSMLEGNVLNGPIGKQMVDTLALCSQNVQDVLQFFTTFLKYSQIVSGVAFQDYDLNGDGIIQPSEFRWVLQSQKVYSEEQMSFLVECADKDSDGRISYKEFSERFSDPASEIGFNIALLFTNLSEHTTNDARLEKLVEAASDLVDIFEDQLGRIEILGGTKRIERVYFEISEENKSSWEAETIKESKREFLFSGVVGMPDMEKLETFINFCEDTIYEMQHTRSLNPEDADSSLPATKKQSVARRFMGWSCDMTKRALRALIMSPWTLLMFLLRIVFFFILKLPYFVSIKLPYYLMRLVVWKPVKTVLILVHYILITLPTTAIMKTQKKTVSMFKSVSGKKVESPESDEKRHLLTGSQSLLPDSARESNLNLGLTVPGEARRKTSNVAFEPQSVIVNEGDSESIAEDLISVSQRALTITTPQEPSSSHLPSYMKLFDTWLSTRKEEGAEQVFDYSNNFASTTQSKQQSEAAAAASKASKNQRSLPNRLMCFLARNYYRIKTTGAILSFFINIILLFCRITVYMPENDVDSDSSAPPSEEAGGVAEGLEPVQVVIMDDDVAFLEPVLVCLSVLHAFIALLILLAYYKLKVPLVIFQREKEVSRKLEFEGLYLTTQPEWSDLRAKLDRVVISSRSFPVNFWDKFVKKRAKSKYSEAVGDEVIDTILGMQDAPATSAAEGASGGTGTSNSSGYFANYDYEYNLWKLGVIFSDQAFLYIFFYFLFSIAGNFSRFFFAIHLMDIAFGNKDLSAILRSVTHNGKQLVLTALLTSIVIYLYTVVAFNFFRDSYVEEAETVADVIAPTIGFLSNDTSNLFANHVTPSDPGSETAAAPPGSVMEQQKCANMWQCFIFHLHHGLRAGGGIGDEIEDPDGQDLMYMRIIFDMTFFFFVIVILLAIIQGLIIDAFGELRGQLEQTKEDLENKCFICGLGKEYFDEQAAHGFEIHSEKEHNFANYMFFLMYLINKDETEFTGQETYVWNLYQKRDFDFFPLGDCFRKQYEEELKN